MATRRSMYNYWCLRRCLIVLNFLFLVFGLLLATLPVYFTVNKMLKSWPINGGIIGMGALLVIIAMFGCYGQYIVILAIIFLMTFAFALAALSLSKAQQRTVLQHGWNSLSYGTKGDIQNIGKCCGFDSATNSTDHPPCYTVSCHDTCSPCLEILEGDWFIAFRRAIGGVSLFVSLLMCISIYFTYRYRHFKNPKANPNEYL